MPRISIPMQFTVQLDNPVQPAAYGSAAIMTVASVMVDQNGKAVSQPAPSQFPAEPEDITPELLAALNAKLAVLGLKLERLDA
ncbi:hypothetical protein [Cupriavidus nantongensis]|uniref:Uncharacterized protein n=1 Tax=Cupriavidus nantongensis TaxID=1796606 RepID=A0A142JHX4_9BURK|nr:hypothetical protein [Cupriavidus nantongensis]AMR77686.1 hypothetical protein A2G96_08025 [Cupriavidus nantongensis]